MLMVSKKDFLRAVSKRSDVPVRQVSAVFSAVLEEIENCVFTNGKLNLSGFGTFYLQTHKGHAVQFSANKSTVPDYVVFKFSASGALNKRMRNAVAAKTQP